MKRAVFFCMSVCVTLLFSNNTNRSKSIKKYDKSIKKYDHKELWSKLKVENIFKIYLFFLWSRSTVKWVKEEYYRTIYILLIYVLFYCILAGGLVKYKRSGIARRWDYLPCNTDRQDKRWVRFAMDVLNWTSMAIILKWLLNG